MSAMPTISTMLPDFSAFTYTILFAPTIVAIVIAAVIMIVNQFGSSDRNL